MHSVEVCAGAGGQAFGLEAAGFAHEALVEIDPHACRTLRVNRPNWDVREGDLGDLSKLDPSKFSGIDLLSGGLPCPPFSVAGKQLGKSDERNLFPETLEIIAQMKPNAIMIENVRGFLSPVFSDYREEIVQTLLNMGYKTDMRLLNASDFGVPQLRPRVVIVAMKSKYFSRFQWPETNTEPPTVGQALKSLMAERGWRGVDAWSQKANRIAPTLVGGSKKHGGPDLGPTRARKAWSELGVNGKTLAEEAPDPDFEGSPRLTVKMAARIQGFSDDWHITGRKTNAYRQVGNAFPPPIAKAVGKSIYTALNSRAA